MSMYINSLNNSVQWNQQKFHPLNSCLCRKYSKELMNSPSLNIEFPVGTSGTPSGWSREAWTIKRYPQGDGVSSVDDSDVCADEGWWWWIWGGEGVGFSSETCLGLNKGMGEVELLRATAGKGLADVAAGSEMVWRTYVGYGPEPVKSFQTMSSNSFKVPTPEILAHLTLHLVDLTELEHVALADNQLGNVRVVLHLICRSNVKPKCGNNTFLVSPCLLFCLSLYRLRHHGLDYLLHIRKTIPSLQR